MCGIFSLLNYNNYDIDFYQKFVNPECISVQRINECDERKNTDYVNKAIIKSNINIDYTVYVSKWLQELYKKEGIQGSNSNVILAGADRKYFNIEGKNFWECWVCKTRGQSIYSLVKQLKLPKTEAQEVLKYVKKGRKYEYTNDQVVELPKEFQPIHSATKTSVIANKVRKYLYDRGLSDNDFIKYNIGYTTTGEYGGRIIIPSYSESNRLNYFVGRTFEGAYFKYKNPEASKT